MATYDKEIDYTSSSVSLKLRERSIYGSSRLGVRSSDMDMLAVHSHNFSMKSVKYEIGKRTYELSNHLGNVLSVISDKVIPSFEAGNLAGMLADVRVAQDYSPFGVVLSGRNFEVDGGYRYGYNTQERVDEIAPGHYTAEFWEYDSRTSRRWNLDPVPDESESQYAVNKNNPIQYNDPNGDCPTCIIGGLIGAAVDYGTQVASNYIKGKENIFTDNINLTSIGVAAVEGFVTSGASVTKNVGAKIAIKTAATIINNTVEIKSSKDGIKVKVEKNVVNIAKNSLIDATVDGLAKVVTPGAKTVQKQLSKTGFNKGQVAKTVKSGLNSANVDVTRKVNNAVKTGADKLVKGTSKAISTTAESGVKATTNSTKDKVKEATNR
jgi:hypothetical protein